MSRFNKDRAAKKQTIIDRLKAFFEKYFGIGPAFAAKTNGQSSEEAV